MIHVSLLCVTSTSWNWRMPSTIVTPRRWFTGTSNQKTCCWGPTESWRLQILAGRFTRLPPGMKRLWGAFKLNCSFYHSLLVVWVCIDAFYCRSGGLRSVAHWTTCPQRWLRGKPMMKRWTCGVWGSSVTSSLLGNHLLRQKLTRRPTAGYQRWAGHNSLQSHLHSSLHNVVFVIQVEYFYPANTNISDGAKDLVSRLLKHNPMHRLPIQGVLAHPWVVERSTKKPTTVSNEQPSKWVIQGSSHLWPPPSEGGVLQNTSRHLRKAPLCR